MVNVAVIGARGYLGRECVRLLLGHPDVGRVVPTSSGAAGEPIGQSVPALAHRSDLVLHPMDHPAVRECDAFILATAGGEAKQLVPRLEAHGASCIIDLSRDHRHEALSNKDGWRYGQADLWPVAQGASRIANPGCYPTATLLAAAPVLEAGLAGPGAIISDGKSGVSGAGATPRADLHYPEANESVRAYKVLGHDHGDEIRLAAGRIEGRSNDAARPVRFTPHLVPQSRGLLATVYIPLAPGAEGVDIHGLYVDRYAKMSFVHVVGEPDTAHVRGGNHAHVAVDVDAESGLIVARCAIDNLQKGGSGTAIQNLNHAFGFDPTAGLGAIGGGP